MKFKISLFIFFIFLFVSCKVRRDVTSTNLIYQDSKSLFRLIENSGFKGDNIYFKKCNFSISIDNKSHSLNGSIFINRDSSIIVSLQAILGIEVARIKFTPFDVVIIERLNKSYTAYSYEQISKKYGLNLSYKSLELLLTNRPFDIDQTPDILEYKQFISTINNGKYYLSSKSSWNLFYRNNFDMPSQVLEILLPDFRVGKNSFTFSNSNLSIQYTNFESLSDYSFPRNLLCEGAFNNHSFLFDLTFNIVLLDVSSGLSFNIPTGYEKVTK